MQQINTCQLCSLSGQSYTLIFTSVLSKLKMLKRFLPSEEETKSPYDNFFRLLRIIFGEDTIFSNINWDCKHKKIKKFLILKLKCTSARLEQLCELFVAEIGQKNFLLDILCLQVKEMINQIQSLGRKAEIKIQKELLNHKINKRQIKVKIQGQGQVQEKVDVQKQVKIQYEFPFEMIQEFNHEDIAEPKEKLTYELYNPSIDNTKNGQLVKAQEERQSLTYKINQNQENQQNKKS